MLSRLGSLCLEAVPALNDSRRPLILGVTIALMVLATAAVGLRVAARHQSKVPFKVDDALIFLALVNDRLPGYGKSG